MPDAPVAVRLDSTNACLWRGSEAIRLTPQAWAVLAVLTAQAGQLVTKATLLETAWSAVAVSEAALVVCIHEIRQALGDTARTPQYLETVHRRGYRFIGPLAPPATGPAAAWGGTGPPAALGREAELRTLHGWLAQAQGGARCVGFVTGEAGIGKTTLVDAFVAQATAAGALWVGRGQCVDQYGAGEAYLPVLEALGQLCRGPEAPRLLALLEQQAPLWLLQLPAVLRAPARETVQRQVQGATSARMLREFAEAVESLTAMRPLVLVLEDLHWGDQATLALVAYLAQRRAPARLLLLGTYRPVEVIAHRHPLHAVHQELALHGQCVDVRLEGLAAAAVAAVVAAHLPGAAVPPAVVETLYRRTDGHPLFLVQMMEALRRQGALVAVGGRWELPGGRAAIEATVPESLRQLIERQFDGLSAVQQQVLEAASVAGQTWTVAAVAAGMEAEVAQVEEWCAALARQGQFVQAGEVVAWPDGTVGESYQFRHALYQQVVYDRVPVGRRLRLHRRIGERLEAGYGEHAGEQATALARHLAAGRDFRRAVQYLQQAADTAAQRHAPHEVIGLLTRGLALLATLPETPARAQQELELHLALGPALVAARGYAPPEVEQTYVRARALCAQIGETPQLFPTLLGLCLFYRNRGALPTARAMGEDLVRVGERMTEPGRRLHAYETHGTTLLFLGEYAAARTLLDQGIALADPALLEGQVRHHGAPSGVWCRALSALALGCLGFPAQALRRSQEALAQAQALAEPQSLTLAHHWAAYLQYRRGEAAAVQAHADALLPLATAQGFPLLVGLGACWRGWALARQGDGEAGLAQLRHGMAAVLDTGQMLSRPLCLVLLAEALGRAGQVAEGLGLLAEALAVLAGSERGDLLAEVYRLQGELLLCQATPDTLRAATCFQQGLTLARRQQARSWELRAAMSLSRLWQQQGKRADAYELLAPIYGWFTEGFDTADLQEAQALLDEISGAGGSAAGRVAGHSMATTLLTAP